MRVAIIAGTGIYDIPEVRLKEEVIETPYGPALVHLAQGELDQLVFLTRHGPEHHSPPHRINYRANIKALQLLGVEKILATNAVGSINTEMPPRGLVVLDDFLDFSSGREATFFDGGQAGVTHIQVNNPYCPALRQRLLELAPEFDLEMQPRGIYVCTNGPRFETPAEIRMYAKLGGDVVGMTGVPEVTLARELKICYAAVALSINWAAGIQGESIKIVRDGLAEVRSKLLALFIKTLQTPGRGDCPCQRSVMTM
jgi:5'-methylthioadenosine phosphorylase